MRGRFDRLIALVESGDAASKAVGPTIATRQNELDRIDHDTAICDAELAAAGIAATSADYVIEKLRGRLVTLDQEPWEVQQAVLSAILWEVFIAEDQNIRMVFRWPMSDLGGGPDDKGGGQPPTSPPTGPRGGMTAPNKTGSPKTTTTVGSYGGSSWRTNTDYVRTVSFMSQMFTRQEGRAHRWIIDGSPLMSAST